MKIPNRLKLIWWAAWHGCVPFTITRVGADQTRGYKQRWKLNVDSPGCDIRIVTADDVERTRGDRYDAIVMDDIMSRPDPNEQPLVDELGPDRAPSDYATRLRTRELPPLKYLPHETMTQKERDELILKDWHKRNPKP